MTNIESFKSVLTTHYVNLFANDPEYAYAKAKMTPEVLAAKMTASLISGSGNKDGNGIKWTCRDLKIAHTYKAIREFLGPKQGLA